MRFCGGFLRRKQVSCPKQGYKAYSSASESVGSTLLAIQHADCNSALQTCLADGVDGLDQRSARRNHVLDQAHAVTRIEHALEPIRGSVLLRRRSDDHEREPRGE